MYVFSAIPAPKSCLPCLFLPACLLLLICLTEPAFAVQCEVAQVSPVSDAEQAYLHGDYDRAATLYQQQLQKNANDSMLVVGLAQTLLKQQNVKIADDLVQKNLVQSSNSVPLLTALAEVQYREGTPWLAAATTGTAMKLDPCYARLHLLNARLYRLSSFYGRAAKELSVAHSLDPYDPAIRLLWLNTLPPPQRIAELESFLAAPTGADSEELAHLRFYLEQLKKEAGEPHKACRLVSNTATTSIDFASIMYNGSRIRAFGLDAKLNDHNARLEIDTGASGLLVSRSVADHAGLKRFSNETIGGVGSQGEAAAYTAYADDIKIGALEFRDCRVEVLEKRGVLDSDGVIGMDVFARFLVTLDYPMRKLILGQLPPRPDDAAPRTPTLETASSANSANDAGATAANSQATASPVKADSRPTQDRYIAPEMKDWTPIYRVHHSLLIAASLNDTRQKLFLLDTGAFTTSISPEVAREVTKVHTENNYNVRGISGKVDKVYFADEIRFKFANLAQKVQNVVSFDTSHLSKDLGMDIGGLIGITAIGQTTMSIDYRDGLVKFAYDPHRGYAFVTSR